MQVEVPLFGQYWPCARSTERTEGGQGDRQQNNPTPQTRPKQAKTTNPGHSTYALLLRGKEARNHLVRGSEWFQKECRKGNELRAGHKGKGGAGAPQHNPKNRQQTTTKGGGVACIVIRRRCNRRGESYKSSLRHQKKRAPQVTARIRVPYTQHHWQGQGGQGQCEKTETTTTQTQTNPTQADNPATLYCSLRLKRGGSPALKAQFSRGNLAGMLGKAPGEDPTPPTKTTPPESTPAHRRTNQAVPRHANQSDAVKHKLKKLAAAQGRSSVRNCEGRSSTPVRLEVEPTVGTLKI